MNITVKNVSNLVIAGSVATRTRSESGQAEQRPAYIVRNLVTCRSVATSYFRFSKTKERTKHWTNTSPIKTKVQTILLELKSVDALTILTTNPVVSLQKWISTETNSKTNLMPKT